jgi:hypothetical protein
MTFSFWVPTLVVVVVSRSVSGLIAPREDLQARRAEGDETRKSRRRWI